MGDANGAAGFLPLRKTKQALDEAAAWDLLCAKDTLYGFLGLHGLSAENGMPYAVPMNFSVDRDARAIYFHTTLDADSKHNRAIAENPSACFTVVGPDAALMTSPDGVACRFTMSFTSVMAFGEVVKVEDPAEKADSLNKLMEQKSGYEKFLPVLPQVTGITSIYKLNVMHISGMKKG